jgi:hypothetical protein
MGAQMLICVHCGETLFDYVQDLRGKLEDEKSNHIQHLKNTGANIFQAEKHCDEYKAKLAEW